MTRTEAYLALNLLPKIGPVRVRRLLEVFHTPERLLQAKSGDIMQVDGFGRELAEAVSKWESIIDLERELKRVDELGLTLLTQEDDAYPPTLREAPSPPLVLYVWGEVTARDHRAIGVVGSRQATPYGLGHARKMSYSIGAAGYTVISGLARGIDTAAHEGALAGGGRTVAVIGAGIGKLYPPENKALAERIAQNGAIVTEFPVDYTPDRQSFPLRNRIVAAWCSGLVVVEAPFRSGSLITAQQAVDMGRTVYAIPGSLDRPSSMGCNRLIQDGAKLIISVDDVLDDQMQLFPRETPKAAAAPVPLAEMTPEQQKIFDMLTEGVMQINEITERSGLPSHIVSTSLMKMEMKRLVKAHPGLCYERLG